MGIREKLKNAEILKGILAAHLILVFHILLIGLIGVVILVLGGLVRNFLWVLLGLCLVAVLSAWWFYRRLRKTGPDILRTMNASDAFKDRPVEIRLLGGVVSVNLGRPNASALLDVSRGSTPLQLEDPDAVRNRELAELTELFAKNAITMDEYKLARQKILKS
jgi:hypothetical protein